MSLKALDYNGYISKVDTTTEMHVISCPKDCYPYSFKSNLSDSVELNKLKQAYNAFSYQLIDHPNAYIDVPYKSSSGGYDYYYKKWSEYVNETIEKISKLAGSNVFIIGYVSYSFRWNCKWGRKIRDENTNIDEECKDCQYERYHAERSWERYDGECGV
jgi:hypothetical protein